MQQATVLFILKAGKQYVIWLESPDTNQASLPVYFLKRDPRQDLVESIEQAADLLRYVYARRQSLSPSLAPSDFNPLQQLGRQMYSTLPAPVRASLRQLDAPLILSTG
jgi:hypothetical protein